MSWGRSVWLSVGAVAVVVAGVLVGIAAHYSEPGEFWGVALPAILTGVGTIVLAIVTVLVTFGAQRVEHERERRSQAEAIAAWTPGPMWRVVEKTQIPSGVAVHIRNGSQQPVYDLWLLQSLVQGSPAGIEWIKPNLQDDLFDVYKVVSSLPPGEWTVRLEYAGTPPPQGKIGIEFAFTDREGQHWQRSATGVLVKLAKTPGELYGVAGPYSYASPTPGVVELDKA